MWSSIRWAARSPRRRYATARGADGTSSSALRMLIGVFWGRYVKTEPAAWASDLQTLFKWLREGRLRPHVAQRYPLERGAEALAAILARKVLGKLVITPVAP